MAHSLIILGAGGHARVLMDALILQKQKILGLTDNAPEKIGQKILDCPILGTDQIILNYSPEKIRLVNALGSINAMVLRQQIFERYKKLGYSFQSVIHPSAIISAQANLGEGVQIMAGAVIQTACKIGENSIINTKSSLDHDCQIGDHVHVAPGVTLCGGVIVNELAYIGAGTTVIQCLNIGPSAQIAAGSLVIKDIPGNTKVLGSPAREIFT